MTRASKSIVRRIVSGAHGEYVVEVRDDILRIRPLRTRAGGKAEVALKWETIYITGFTPPNRRKRKIKRGKV